MNVIAYDRAYALYPRATFEDHLSLYCKQVDDRDLSAIQKYKSRGWTIVHEWPTVDPFSLQPINRDIIPLGPRWIGDKHSWSISLSLQGITSPPPLNSLSLALSTDPCFVTSWEMVSRPLRAHGWSRQRRGMRIVYDMVTADGFFHKYLCAQGENCKRLMTSMRLLQQLYIDTNPALDDQEEFL